MSPRRHLLIPIFFATLLLTISAGSQERSSEETFGCMGCCPGERTTLPLEQSVDFVLLIDHSDSMTSQWGRVSTTLRLLGKDLDRLLGKNLDPSQPAEESTLPRLSTVAGNFATFPDANAKGPSSSSERCQNPVSPLNPKLSELGSIASPTFGRPTPLAAALNSARVTLTNSPRPIKVIMLLTDGVNTCGTGVNGGKQLRYNHSMEVQALLANKTADELDCDRLRTLPASLARDTVLETCDAIDAIAPTTIRLVVYPIPGAPLNALNALGKYAMRKLGDRATWNPVAIPNAREMYRALLTPACTFDPARHNLHDLSWARVKVGGASVTRLTDCSDTTASGWCTGKAGLTLAKTTCDAFLDGKAVTVSMPVTGNSTTSSEGVTKTRTSEPCHWEMEPKEAPRCPRGKTRQLKFCKEGLGCEPVKNAVFTTCPTAIFKREDLAKSAQCPSGGYQLSTCYDENEDGQCQDAELDKSITPITLCNGKSGKDGADGKDGLDGMPVNYDPPPAGSAELDALNVTMPGDRSVFRLHMAGPRVGGTGPDFGAVIGVHPYRAYRALRRLASKGIPFYNDPLVDGFQRWLDTLELSSAIIKDQRLFFENALRTQDVYSFGLMWDFLEGTSTSIGQQQGAVAMAKCIEDEAKLRRDKEGAAAARQDVADEITQGCFSRDTPFVLGGNFVGDTTRDLSGWWYLHGNVVALLRTSQDAFRLAAQAGFDAFPGADDETAGAGRGRSAADFALRLDARAANFTFKLEGSYHPHFDGGEGYGEFGTQLDVALPLSFVLSPGYRMSKYDGSEEHGGYLSIGTTNANILELFPAARYLRWQQ